MEITGFSCGCSISSSMFGDRPILMIALCNKHACDAQIQSKLAEAATMLSSKINKEIA
jgi:hypothetical protein